MKTTILPLTLAIVLLVGCTESPDNSAPPQTPPAATVQKPAPPPPPPPPEESKPSATPPVNATNAAEAPNTPAGEMTTIPPGMVQEKAQVGAGEKGRDYGEGIITTPVSTYFKVRERVAYEIQIPKAMQLYKEMEGHNPRSHGEFMDKIIKANSIPLPTLPPGHEYRYDPKTAELTVVHPKE